MKKKILVTDSLFIHDKHVKKLEDNGYEVERLDKPEATEAELIEAIKGKDGYILGGVEKVTDKVIESANELKAIVFTGTGWDGFITGHQLATEKGIAIGAAPHLNAHAVAEFGFAMTLVMCRDMINLARGGSKKFETTSSISELKIGVVGLGHVGHEYITMANGLSANNVCYYNRTKKPDLEKELSIKYKEKQELFETCDIVFVSVGIRAGQDFIAKEQIDSMKEGSILVSIADPLLFDLDTLHSRLQAGTLRGAFDENIKEDRFTKLPIGIWYTPNESSAFNTGQTIDDVSNNCVETMINLLNTGDDKHLMNPDYKNAR